MIRTIVGYTFTDHMIVRLEKLGFTLSRTDKTTQIGYHEFICPMSAEQGLKLSFEIREVLDENLYFSHNEKKDFAPFISENSAESKIANHPNSVSSIQDILYSTMAPNELTDFFSIKKLHPLWALWLRCDDFNAFERFAGGEMKTTWQNQPAYLIHLGESCFDLLVTGYTKR